MTQREQLLARLAELEIPFELTEHLAVYTIDEMEAAGINGLGEVCKNLFLRNQKGDRHFIAVLPCDRRADLAGLSAQLDCGKLSFASPERLERYLGLHKGAVTPFGLLNDVQGAVEVALDSALIGRERLGFHPNDNTATVWVTYDALRRFLAAQGDRVCMVTL